MNDDIYEQSAQHATNLARRATLERTERPAQEAGFQARGIQDGVMDDSWRTKGGANSGAPGDVQAKEQRANRQAVDARRAVMETGGLSMDDLISVGLSDKDDSARADARMVRSKMAQVAGHMVQQGARRVVHDAYMDPNEASMLMEQEAYRQQATDDGWAVVKRSATLASGKSIPVFMVEDSVSGMSTGKKYRLSEVAQKVARVLNVSNNPDDARIRMIDQAYDQHVKLMRERADAKKTGNARALSLIESKLAEVNARLGLD